MAVEYVVRYKDRNGVIHNETRDTVERGYYLYKSYASHESCVELLEVCNGEEIRLRPVDNSYESKEIENERERPKETRKAYSMFEMMFGCTREEYYDAVRDFAQWHGATLADWGLE